MIKTPINKRWQWTLFLFVILLRATVGSLSFFSSASGDERMEEFVPKFPQREIPKPQPFCGYCHILTYPSVVQKGYELWKRGKHNQVGCVECHYPPLVEGKKRNG